MQSEEIVFYCMAVYIHVHCSSVKVTPSTIQYTLVKTWNLSIDLQTICTHYVAVVQHDTMKHLYAQT